MEKYLTCEQVAENHVKVITVWAWIREKVPNQDR